MEMKPLLSPMLLFIQYNQMNVQELQEMGKYTDVSERV
jgi:hypothetical protein